MAGVWTNNWKAFRNIMLMGCHHNGFSTVIKRDGTTIASESETNLAATTPMGLFNSELGATASANTILLGTGNAAPAATDYDITTDSNLKTLSVSTGVPTFDDNSRTMTRAITVAVQNQGPGNITIREWGIFGTIRSLNYYSAVKGTALLYREVLSTAVTLAPLQAATLTLTMTLTLTDIL